MAGHAEGRCVIQFLESRNGRDPQDIWVLLVRVVTFTAEDSCLLVLAGVPLEVVALAFQVTAEAGLVRRKSDVTLGGVLDVNASPAMALLAVVVEAGDFFPLDRLVTG